MDYLVPTLSSLAVDPLGFVSGRKGHYLGYVTESLILNWRDNNIIIIIYILLYIIILYYYHYYGTNNNNIIYYITIIILLFY